MDCSEAVEDYCDAWAVGCERIPKNVPSFTDNLDRYFIILEVEKTIPKIHNIDKEDHQGEFVEVESTNSLTFWVSCPRSDKDNLSKEMISSMLTSAGVPLHKQEYMVDKISSQADQIANAECNKGSKILPMFVFISIVACLCMSGETNDDYHDGKGD
ncbi:hypothetical protein CDL12_18221 [Handroanthus impetiginosus]|uniref:Uncharacterized protein n=1 Tax=Handroanthus impetiginosus TaxID=429701 RepID=A0A2G9GVG3_9LAMI|nr:hypothetical protein CDL12_18221 [Handroanthus impetiginosus]